MFLHHERYLIQVRYVHAGLERQRNGGQSGIAYFRSFPFYSLFLTRSIILNTTYISQVEILLGFGRFPWLKILLNTRQRNVYRTEPFLNAEIQILMLRHC
jgi:hypothetical protein